MEKTVNKKRLIYLDILNIIAILCVIAMHCNGVVHSYSTQRWWRTSLIVECVAYFAVPLFLMISSPVVISLQLGCYYSGFRILNNEDML